jgi:hypothetical protein
MKRSTKVTAGAVNGLKFDHHGNAKRPTWPWFGSVNALVEDIQDIPATLVRNGLDFTYATRPLYRKIEGPSSLANTDLFEVSKLRSEVVAVTPFGEPRPLHAHVSPRHSFTGHQPEDLVRFFAGLAAQHPLEFESLMVLDHGRTVFAAAKAYRSRSTMFETEIIEPFVCFATGVDRATSIWVEINLPNCMNAFPNFLNQRSALRYTHHRALDIDKVLDNFELETTARYQADISAMARAYLDTTARRRYFAAILWDNRATLYSAKMSGHEAPRTAAELSDVKFDRHQAQIVELEHWHQHGAGQEQDCRKQNVWGALNAVLFWTDHAKRTNVHERSSRANSILAGPLAGIKRSALTRARALAA